MNELSIIMYNILFFFIDTFYFIKEVIYSSYIFKLICSQLSKHLDNEPQYDHLSITTLNGRAFIQLKNNGLYFTKELVDFIVTEPSKLNIQNDTIYKIKDVPTHMKNLAGIRVISLSNTSFINIEYSHPKLNKSLTIKLPKSYFVVGNDLLSDIFVSKFITRKYGKDKVIDMNYVLNIIDNNVKIFTLNKSQYIQLTLNGYEIMTNHSSPN